MWFRKKSTQEADIKTNTNTQPDVAVEMAFSFRRWKTRKIIRNLKLNKISTCYFYTDVKNVLQQLEMGIQPLNHLRLKRGQEHVVWTYLEHSNHIELELENSTRYFFWNWIADNNVDPNTIAVVAINLNKLFNNTKEEFKYNEAVNRLSIYETISPMCIDWILIKDFKYWDRIEQYLHAYHPEIKLLYGTKGEVVQPPKKSKK